MCVREGLRVSNCRFTELARSVSVQIEERHEIIVVVAHDALEEQDIGNSVTTGRIGDAEERFHLKPVNRLLQFCLLDYLVQSIPLHTDSPITVGKHISADDVLKSDRFRIIHALFYYLERHIYRSEVIQAAAIDVGGEHEAVTDHIFQIQLIQRMSYPLHHKSEYFLPLHLKRLLLSSFLLDLLVPGRLLAKVKEIFTINTHGGMTFPRNGHLFRSFAVFYYEIIATLFMDPVGFCYMEVV